MDSDTENAPSPPSIVNWHVAFWVLLSLALNSMAQPSGCVCGLPPRFRVYMRSSPIVCAVDGFAMLTALIITSIYLRISPRKATDLILLERYDDGDADAADEIEEARRPEAQELRHATWFRWLFFIMSALPAAIKLGSFSGMPWTKTWGMMFVCSFVVIELISLLSISSTHREDYASIPEVLGITHLDWQTPKHYTIRRKTKVLIRYSFPFQVTMRIVMFTAHAILVACTAVPLLLDFFTFALDSELGQNASTLTKFIALNIIIITGLIYWIDMEWELRLFRSRQISGKTVVVVLLKVYFVGTFLPEIRGTPSEFSRKIQLWTRVCGAPCLIAYAWHGLYAPVLYALKWWFGINDKQVSDSLSPSSDDTFLRNVRTSSGEDTVDPTFNNPIDEDTWWAMGFFVFNLIVCVLWYAFRYDPTGTINPTWTDVFG